MDICLDIADFAIEGFLAVCAVFELLALLEDRLGLLLIIPEIGIAGFCFQFG
jgi:hypothetical protein